jgi:hypothetical protein
MNNIYPQGINNWPLRAIFIQYGKIPGKIYLLRAIFILRGKIFIHEG